MTSDDFHDNLTVALMHLATLLILLTMEVLYL